MRHERGEGRDPGCFTIASGPTLRSASSPRPSPPFRTEERETEAPERIARTFAKTEIRGFQQGSGRCGRAARAPGRAAAPLARGARPSGRSNVRWSGEFEAHRCRRGSLRRKRRAPGARCAFLSAVSVFANVRAVGTVTSVSLSSVRNGGEGRGEEALRHVETVGNSGAPLSPTLSPFVPHGARETDALLVAAVPARTFTTTAISEFALNRNYSVAPILVDHRDTMDTEKTKHSLCDIGSLIGDFPEQMPPLVLLCVHRASVVLSAVATASLRLNR